MQMQHDGQLFTHKLRVPTSTLNVFRSYSAYMDMEQRVHARVVLVSLVVYLDLSVLQEMRIAVPEQSQDIYVGLEVLLVNGGAVQGECTALETAANFACASLIFSLVFPIILSACKHMTASLKIICNCLAVSRNTLFAMLSVFLAAKMTLHLWMTVANCK